MPSPFDTARDVNCANPECPNTLAPGSERERGGGLCADCWAAQWCAHDNRKGECAECSGDVCSAGAGLCSESEQSAEPFAFPADPALEAKCDADRAAAIAHMDAANDNERPLPPAPAAFSPAAWAAWFAALTSPHAVAAAWAGGVGDTAVAHLNAGRTWPEVDRITAEIGASAHARMVALGMTPFDAHLAMADTMARRLDATRAAA